MVGTDGINLRPFAFGPLAQQRRCSRRIDQAVINDPAPRFNPRATQVKRGELFKIDLQLIQDNQKRHNGELFKIKFAVV
ncbi:hypothetical protein L2063_002916 [Salmonella enterica subsp. enterica serovar Newport]|nr:hypothetical protein [Salmonella enterica subsp. enterica serovar Newport]EIT6971829.1 hypothetical protein [Salmonella enterica subsp. enterica serovar Newport]